MPTFTKPITKAAFFSAVLLLSNLAMVLSSGVLGAEVLQEGTWSGTYAKSQHHAQYEVTKSTSGEETIINITMRLSELELVHEIKDVQIRGNSLFFTIHKKHEKQDCTLRKQESDQYIGTCKSEFDSAGESLSHISMTPPVAIENENPEPEPEPTVTPEIKSPTE